MSLDVAIAGATGAVGADLLKLLAERDFPVGRLRVLASERSRGRTVTFRDEKIEVEPLSEASFADVDVAFFSCGSSRSREHAPRAVRQGALVVDNSSAFRMDPEVPLVVPEINPGDLGPDTRLVANPNCTTIVTLMAVAPLHAAAKAVALRAASYQAASGAGARAMNELLQQTGAVSRGEEPQAAEFPYPLAYNVIPHVGAFGPDGYTEEETKLKEESRKILAHPDLAVSATCVRVPVLRAHSVAVWLETAEPLTPKRARGLLDEAPGVIVLDDPETLSYPMPRTAAGSASVQVGRIRAEGISGSGLSFFVAGDQLLKGAALNAIQIAEVLVRKGYV